MREPGAKVKVRVQNKKGQYIDEKGGGIEEGERGLSFRGGEGTNN